MAVYREKRSEKDPRFSEQVVESFSRTGWERMSEALSLVYELDPDWTEAYTQYIRGDLYSREVLPQSIREICACAALSTIDKQSQVRTHLLNGYAYGATKEQLLEAVLQSVTYGGFPSALASIRTYADVFPDMRKKDRTPPPAVDPPATEATIYNEAFETSSKIRGAEVTQTSFDGLKAIDPAMFLAFQRLVYRGLYARTVLEPKVRQFVAVACCTVKNALPQLVTHARGALRLGAKREEVREVIFQMSAYGGFPYMFQALEAYERMADEWEKSEGKAAT
ncbi:MAG: carboxymuconolactone decarboxylase family protein [Chloroflexi bacterium]|nr:carboxymuconolactone decarboxylase family protein [Chloroflexota bacterium]